MSRVASILRDIALVACVIVLAAWSANRLQAAPDERIPEVARYRTSPLMLAGPGPDTVVVWFDYECKFCRTLGALMDSVQATDPQAPTFAIRPVLTYNRTYAMHAFGLAYCAAAVSPTAGRTTHRALMDSIVSVSADSSVDIGRHLARAVAGEISADSLYACAADHALRRRIGAMAREGDRLGLTESPAFIIGNRLYRGTPLTLPAFRQMLAQ